MVPHRFKEQPKYWVVMVAFFMFAVLHLTRQ